MSLYGLESKVNFLEKRTKDKDLTNGENRRKLEDWSHRFNIRKWAQQRDGGSRQKKICFVFFFLIIQGISQMGGNADGMACINIYEIRNTEDIQRWKQWSLSKVKRKNDF